jgi:hypothetical protein
MADGNTIIVSADFGHALFVLEKHVKAASELTAAITAINEYCVDLDDDAVAAIEQEKFGHSVAASAIADALQITCPKHLGVGARILGPIEIVAGACMRCGAKIVVEEVKQ